MKHRNPVETLADIRHEFGEHGGVNMSVEASTTFTVLHSNTMPEIFGGEKGPEHGGCYLYGRHFNPTVYNLSKQLAALEGTEAAYCTASGMSAISATLMQLCDAGDHIISSNAVYGGTYALLHDLLPPKTGIKTSLVDITDLDAVEAAITDRTRVIYTESISNPTLRLADIPRLSAITRRYGIKLVVDNTFSPLILSPKELGADIVVHTGMLMILGPTMDPQVAFNISLRIPHLPLRMTEHARRTRIFAERLHAMGMTVTYPGLASHPDHALMSKLHCPDYGYGGILTLDMGSQSAANELLDLLQNEYRFGYVAVSLGYFDTLMSCSGSSTSSELADEDKAAACISPGLVRMSIGYTGATEQRWSQLEDALERVSILPSQRSA